MENQAQEMEMGNTVVVALDNLPNTAFQKNDTFEQLVISNASLSAFLTARDTNIARLITVINNLYPRVGSGGGGGSGTNNEKATKLPWDPTGYCWTHGYNIRVGHISATCIKFKDGNDARLTSNQGDIQGG